MTRRIEGTTLGGFSCDFAGCDQNGAYTPMLVVPWEGEDALTKEPITMFVDTHSCWGHFHTFQMDRLFSARLRKEIDGFAEARHGHADWKRARIQPYRTTSQRYLEFQQHTGIVPPDDALAKGAVVDPTV